MSLDNMLVRPEVASDIRSVHEVNRAAFSPAEARLVDVLRGQDPSVVSLVAESGGDIVGHILFSRVVVQGAEGLRAVALGPLAVAPEYQRQGIGTALVRAGLTECRHNGWDAVFVLGHSTYYPRFGFMRASGFDIRCEFDVPDDSFFAIELVDGALRGKSGIVRYAPPFKSVTESE